MDVNGSDIIYPPLWMLVGTCAKSWDNYSGNLAQAEKSPTYRSGGFEKTCGDLWISGETCGDLWIPMGFSLSNVERLCLT